MNEFKLIEGELWIDILSDCYNKIHSPYRSTILSGTVDVYDMINPINQNINVKIRSISYHKINRMGKIVYDPVGDIL